MAPKKPPITQREHTINSEEEECEPSSAQRPTENVSEIANLRQMLQGFIDSQHQKDEELQREARRQDQRWRSLQHQFGLLQEEVRKGQRGVQQDPEAQHSETPTGQAHSRIYRPVVSAHEREGEHRGAPLMAWPRLPQLKDTDDIEHYFLMFERLALAARWPRADWAFHLVPLLEGKARAAYVAMCADEIHDFNAVKEAILRKFEINPETYRQRFRKDTVLEDETPKELFTRLTGLYERWMRPKGKSKDEIGQTIVLEQFLNMINPELKSWIMERSPGSAAQAIEMADAYVAARQAEGKFRLGKPHSSKQTSRDIPVLIDLLNKKQANKAEVMVMTRQQSKNTAKQTVKLLTELPYAVNPKQKKSKMEKRKEKVKGTKMSEKVELPGASDISLPTTFEQCQSQDETLKPLFNKCKQFSDNPEEGCHLTVKHNKLYRVTDKGEQLVLPQGLREEVLRMGHSDPWAGHFGQAKTFSRIAHRFYWPGQYADIVKFCKNCPECQLTAYQKKSDRVPMVNMPIIDVPFSRIAMDVVGPLPRTKNGNRYILVVCDYATKYPEAFALKTVKTRQIVNALVQLISRVGIPREILTDQGTNFTSKQIKAVYNLLGIKAIHTTPYHPQTDGLTERFNQTLKQILRKLANSNGTDWDAWLPFALFAYREVPQASSGFSPFELLYGRQVRGPLDVLKEAWDGENKEEKLNILSYVLKMREKLSQLTETVHVNMEKAQEQQKRWYDKAARKRVLKPRQKVLILLPTSDTGLLAKWQGPYEVHRQVGETTYELHLPERKKKFQSFHINMLRPWNEPDTTSAEQLWIRAVEEDEEVKEQYFPTGGGCEVLPEVSHLNAQQQKELLRVIPLNLFSEKPGRTAVTHHSIRLSKDEPIRQTTCRVPARLVPELKNEVEEMLKMGIIEPSDSEWCSPVVLVPKKDGGLRFCVDFSKLNAVSAFDPYPMPRADELIERLGKAKVLSTLDLCKGYWQVPLSQSSRKLTAFRTPSGLYHFLTMPFGLHGSAATFQRLMDKVLRGTEGFAAAYIDDVVIYSSSWEEHLRHLSIVMRKITEAGLTANPSKCHLALGEVSYLGYILGGGQIRPQVDKVEAVKATPQPSTKRRVRSFLGLVGWYRRFIPNFATKATALTDLTKNDQPQRVKWTENCEHSFNELKNALCEEPVLASPDFSKPFIVQTDASGSGLGAVLLQGEGEDRKPILYISRKLFPREVKYSTIEKEALAIKWALDSLKYYLLGNDFVLETDHRALQWIRRMKDSNARITRWYLSLQPYRFDIVYRKGSQNVIADYLSRHWEGVELEGG
ncbi:hypothetical protein NFI96_014401, partial [Prochilodus magdalenae]